MFLHSLSLFLAYHYIGRSAGDLYRRIRDVDIGQRVHEAQNGNQEDQKVLPERIAVHRYFRNLCNGIGGLRWPSELARAKKEIGRASCRERVKLLVVEGMVIKRQD